MKLSPEIVAGLSPWATSIRQDGERLALTVASTEVLPEVTRYLVGRGVDVYEVTPQRISLEERFLQIVGEDKGL
jgi:hypothetical protein